MNIDKSGKEFAKFCSSVGVFPHEGEAMIGEALFGALNRLMGDTEPGADVLAIVGDHEARLDALESAPTPEPKKKPGRPKRGGK